MNEGSALVLGLRKSDWGLALLPLTALLEQLDAFKALENGAFAADGGVGLEGIVLGHLGAGLDGWDAEAIRRSGLWQWFF